MKKTMKKQSYKSLTKAQGRKAISLARKGVSQQKIAKQLGIAKQSVSTHLRSKGVGKRASGTFWGDVKAIQAITGDSWKESRLTTYKSQKWGLKRAKRHGKTKYRDFKDFWADQMKDHKSQEEKQEALEEEMEDTYFESK